MAGNLDLVLATGTNFGPVEIFCKASTGAVVPLAGWQADAQVRLKPGGDVVVVDLNPAIAADDTAGLVTLPEIDWAATAALPVGNYMWDLILQDPSGRKLPPLLAGRFTITRPVTKP